MKNFNLISIDSGFDDDFKNSSYKQELQDLYLLLDKHCKESCENLKINEPNLELIKNLVNSLDSLNELEFIIALKQVQKLNKVYPITINFTSDLSSHYKKYAQIISVLKGHEQFKKVIKMLEDNLNSTYDENNSTEFISYINGLYIYLKYFQFSVHKLWDSLKHYRQGKYIINFDKPLNYLNWHIEKDLFNEIKEKGVTQRTVNVDIFELETARKLSTIQLVIDLKLDDNKHTQENYSIGFKPVNIGYKFVKTEWVNNFDKQVISDFIKYSKPHSSVELKGLIQDILEEKRITFADMISLQKEIIVLHNNEMRREIYKNKCKYKNSNHSMTCNNEFLTYDKRTLFCYECSLKPDKQAQTTRIHRERKAKQ